MNKVEEQIKQAEARYGAPMPEMYRKELYKMEALNESFNKIFGEPHCAGLAHQQELEQQQQEEEAQEEQEENGSS
tara:strand:- start:9242 stop:9466 length:225 start_codon:yes stop_codon:yes gene_type:complete